MRKILSRYDAFGRRLNPEPMPEEANVMPNVWIPNHVYSIYRKVARERAERKREKK